jgi:hypothetical protein
MGVDRPETSPRSSCDDDDDDDIGDDPETALNPCDDEGDNMAPLLRLRRLPLGGREDAGSGFHSVEGNVVSVYVTMHRYGRREELQSVAL